MELLAIEIHHGAITILDFKENRAEMFLSRKFSDELDRHGIGPAMLSPFLANFDACLLHASAIVHQGRAAVFIAPDAGGKTTASSLAPNGSVIGDDQILLRRISGGFQVSGTPWGLQIDSNLRAPLAGLFILEKAQKFSLAPITSADLVSCLWQEGKDLLSILPKPLKSKAFEIWCDLAAAVPAAKLSFPRDHIDWEALERMMND